MSRRAGANAGGPASPPRLRYLDACRGLAVLTMLLANFVNVFLHRVPPLLTHNYGDVLRPFDFPAPVFQFLVGVSLALFLRKHLHLGRTPRGAKVAALRRFALLVLLGMLLDCVGALHVGLRWGVLQTLGLGGMIATLLADAPGEGIVGVAIALLGCFSGALNGEVHANPIAALSFVPLTLGGLLVGRVLPRGQRGELGRFISHTALLGAGAGALAAVFYGAGIPFNKTLGTSSFVALAAGVSATTLAGMALVESLGVRFPDWLLAVGANALTAWVLQYVLVYYPAWIAFPAWRRLPFVAGMAAILATTTALSALTVALGRRGIRIPI
ncbi:MAG: DUF1624 domain-containing protein [Deltaproteobacteria bacterium]|nr:MAG: DUF1624 domain-containing protein [Deltaproteobacteria bacterium]TMA54838.1 MAG: DUF1624 domain-containing protein [Deltaproteobacteria bacterium]